MGDHRASIKILMTAHGKEYKWDAWINWSPDEPGGCDQRVIEWFQNAWADAYARYDCERIAAETEKAAARLADEEARERAEYERLKLKFGAD